MIGELPSALVTVAEVARYLNVSSDWIYSNADLLGARRLGSGPRARLRFSLAEIDERLTRPCSAHRESDEAQTREPAANRRRRRRAGLGTTAPLLPIRGRRVA